MENEGRIVELLTEKLIRFDQQHTDLGDLKIEFKELRKDVNEKFGQVNNKLSSLEEQIVKLNLISAENSRSLMKLADNNERINRLEKAVFK